MSSPTISQALLSHGAAFPLEPSAETLMEQMAELRAAVLDSSWEVVAQHALSTAGSSQGSAQALTVGSFARRGRMPELFANIIAALMRKIRADPNIGDPATALTQLLPDDVPEEAKDLLLELIADDLDSAEERLTPSPPLKSEDMSGVLAARALALSALSHAAFNLDHALGNSNSFFPREQMIDALGQLVARKQSDLDAAIGSLRDACRRDSGDPQKLAAIAGAGLLAEEAIVHLSHTEAKGLLLFRDLLDEGKGTSAEEVGRILAQAHWQSRDWICFSLAAIRLVPALAFGKDGADEIDALIASARSDMQVKSELPNGTDREIHSLGPQDEGQFIERRGHVTEVSARIDDEDRLIGRVEIQDPSSGARATLAILFVNPANAGIMPGAFVQASGIWRQQLDTIGGSAGLLVDTLAPTELAQASWSFGFLDLAEAWFPRHRNRKNMIWSRAPHRIGGALDPSAQGAAELVFLRFGAVPAEEDQ